MLTGARDVGTRNYTALLDAPPHRRCHGRAGVPTAAQVAADTWGPPLVATVVGVGVAALAAVQLFYLDRVALRVGRDHPPPG